jgi:hypothetical protein
MKGMGGAQMAKKKDERNEAGRAIAKAIMDQYKPSTTEEMQDALREIFGPMFEAMLQGEMDSHLGYESNNRGAKNRQNDKGRQGNSAGFTLGGEKTGVLFG